MNTFKIMRKSLKRKRILLDEFASFCSKDLLQYTLLINRISKHLMLILFLFFCMLYSFGQDNCPEIKHTQIFSLSPISKKVDRVNGLVFGVGHYPNSKVGKQTINGLNVDVSPIGLLVPFGLFYLPELIKNNNRIKINNDSIVSFSNYKSNSVIQMNGINLSTGAFITSVSQNGLNISLMNKFYNYNGLTINALAIHANKLNGCSFALYNGFNTQNGFTFGIFNESNYLKGVQLGMYNYSTTNKGIQIGVLNMSKSKGFQFGLWNINAKRSLPIINW